MTQKKPDEDRPFTHGETACLQRHKEGWMCSRPRAHAGWHKVYNLQGEYVMQFRGGRPYWPE
jgi:hypothetical protein